MTSTLFRGALALGLLTVCLAQEILSTSTMSSTGELSPTTSMPMKKASYWITYSTKVRPGHPMVFQVQIFEGKSPVEMFFALKNVDGVDIIRHGPVSVMPGDPRTVSVDIPYDVRMPTDNDNHYWRQYTVEVTGRSNEISIKEKGQASYEKKAFSIFVQTDKAMYKPSQTVQFRTLAMTPDMKVLRDVKQDIVVSDSRGNKILQFKGVQASEKLGVFEKSFRLASSVPTGAWVIKVTIQGVEEKKEFEVAEYVLPRFEVEVDGPSFGVSSDLLYECTVRAKYTFGKPVTEGTVVASVDLPNVYGDHVKPILKRGKLDSNGEMKVQLTLDELLRHGNSYRKYYDYTEIPQWWSFRIMANVTETRTGRQHSGESDIQFHSSPIKLTFLGITPSSFKSGLDYTAYIEVRKQDDTMFSPLELKQMNVMINVTYSVPITKTTTTTTTTTPPSNGKPDGPIKLPMVSSERFPGHWYPNDEMMSLELDKHIHSIPETGWIILTFRVPDKAKEIDIRAETISPFREVQTTKRASKSYSPTDSFLQLSVLNKKPRVGEMVQVIAKSTDSMKLLNYQVFSKGSLISSSDVQGPSSNLAFQFEATAAMSPSMSIVAFYVMDDGEFVVDALSLSVDGLFDNAVSVEFSKEMVKPGEAVDLVVRGEKDSVVFLLVLDKSVKLLKSGNDITQDMVREELASYDFGGYGDWRYMFICGWPSYFGGTDANSVFNNAGVKVMTDGLIYNRYDDLDEYLEERPTLVEKVPDGSSNGASRPSNDNSMKPAERTRKYFPENWLWKIKVIDAAGMAVVPLTSPDTITSWLASAFSVNPSTGLSIADKPAEVITFRDMFISLDLPASIVRGEDFCFPASVFSYYKGSVPVLLTMEPSPDFENIWAKKENNVIILEKGQMYYSYFMGFMNENDVKTVTFCFTPITIGSIPIRVSAMTDVASLSDAVERKLRVKPEGVPHTTTHSFIVTPTNGAWTEQVPVDLPANIVSGSERISVNIAGNLLGPIFDNLDDLLQKPYGCGEQNMINFSPIMSLVDFFFTTNTMTDAFREKAVDYMLIGYQKEILYEHGTTGGYSTFGNRDTEENPSMWLTAFITKCFSQAEMLDVKYKNILAMDVALIHRSAMWMIDRRNQKRDGSFVENGRVFNKRLQGGSSTGIALTAYTVISLHHVLKVLKAHPDFDNEVIDRGFVRAVMYLENNFESLKDSYDICITTYALTLVGSPEKNKALALMEKMAKKGFGMTNWERPQTEERDNYYWSTASDAINIEMTSYALLTYSLLGKGTTDGLPIIRWLSKQKGPNGGFISTQDTVIGIEALTSVAKDLYGSEFVPMTIKVSSKNAVGVQDVYNFQVTKDNEMILQRNDIPYQKGNDIELFAQPSTNLDTSKSTVLVDLVFNYNVMSETQVISYDMSHQIVSQVDGFDLLIKIWTTDGSTASMSLLEVDIPAGHEPDTEKILSSNPVISELDIKEDRLNIYIQTDVINGSGIKLKINMAETGGKLVKGQGKNYKISNYYEPGKELTKTYTLPDEGDFCSKMPSFGICTYE